MKIYFLIEIKNLDNLKIRLRWVRYKDIRVPRKPCIFSLN
jgi:hypothetical protein